MEPTQSDREQLIMRYLAGRLPASESTAFEQTLAEDPALREQTEEVLKLREGLARLQERRELEALLPKPLHRAWVPYAAAATLVLVTLAALVWLAVSRQGPVVLASSPGAFAPGRPVSGPYPLVRTRSTASVLEVSRNGLILLQVLSSVTAPSYRARISPRNGTTLGAPSEPKPAGGDGYVLLYLDTQRLSPGDYEISLYPVGADAAANSENFPIRVR